MQRGPGQHRADERGGGEDDLASGSAEVAGAFDPQGDRGAVAERSDEQGGQNLSGLDVQGGRDGEAEQ